MLMVNLGLLANKENISVHTFSGICRFVTFDRFQIWVLIIKGFIEFIREVARTYVKELLCPFDGNSVPINYTYYADEAYNRHEFWDVSYFRCFGLPPFVNYSSLHRCGTLYNIYMEVPSPCMGFVLFGAVPRKPSASTGSPSLARLARRTWPSARFDQALLRAPRMVVAVASKGRPPWSFSQSHP